MSIHQPHRGSFTRRHLIAAAAAAAATPLAWSQAAWKPSSTVKIVVPFPPGGSADILSRVLGPAIGERLGQSVVVENRAGATGSIGTGFVYGAPPDGTTLLMAVADSVSIYPHLTQAKFDATRFVPVAGVAATAFVLLGRPDLPANNLQELIALAKRDKLSFASAGTGSGPHMMTAALQKAAGLDNLLHVPYNGMAPGLQALMAKQVDIMMVAVGGATQYRNQLKFYGVSSAARVAAIQDVPTLTEQGLPLVGEAWIGILAPPGTPAAISATLAREFGDLVQRPEFRTRVSELGMRTIGGTQPEFAKYYQDEYRKWGEVVKAANIKLD